MVSKKLTHETPIHCGDHVYIQPTYFIIKPDFIGVSNKRTQKQIDNQKHLENNTHNGNLSSKSISKLKNSVNWLLAAAKYKAVYSKREQKTFWFKVNFITLTIPPQKNNVVSEKIFQKCLNTFLVYSRKYRQLHNYVWKIEAHEDKRLHIHITTDIFYHYRDLRNTWNRILQREGLLTDHYNKFQNYDPNSTDVHAVHKVKNVAGYICGYMQKKPNLPEGFKGRIWSASYSLSKKNKCYCYLDKGSDRRNFSFVDRPMIRYKQIQGKPDSFGKTKTVASMYCLYGNQWQTEMDGIIKDAYNRHRLNIRNNTPSQPPEYLTIDFFGNYTKPNYEFINLAEQTETQCEIEKPTQKNGLIQLDLGF